MRETTPAVYLIAQPQLNWGEVARYLNDVGGEAWLSRVGPTLKTPAVASDPELLVEFAGRGCYRSWDAGLNANVTKVREDTGEYLRNIIDVGHGSVLEHAQFTFVFQDVSRVFTHELVRHRTGVAISQESLRYVRLTDLGVRIPPILNDPSKIIHDRDPDDTGVVNARPMAEAIVNIVELLEDFQMKAAEAFGLDDEGVPFHYKKEVTSALRRLAPIGLSTMMTWSANIRTLRHVIEMRTSLAAEEEIRIVFQQVAERMRHECPLLFADYEVNADGEWIPGTRKV
jgi:thymidylate synthase (FAD)